jgi:hypothetical protein
VCLSDTSLSSSCIAADVARPGDAWRPLGRLKIIRAVRTKRNPDLRISLLAGFTIHSPGAEVTTLQAPDHRFHCTQTKSRLETPLLNRNLAANGSLHPHGMIPGTARLFSDTSPLSTKKTDQSATRGRFHHLLHRAEVTRLQARDRHIRILLTDTVLDENDGVNS